MAKRRALFLSIFTFGISFACSCFADDLDDSARIFFRTVVIDQQIRPSSAAIGGAAKLGLLTLDAKSAYDDYKNVRAGNKSVAEVGAGMFVEKIADKAINENLDILVAPICRMKYAEGPLPCLAATAAVVTAGNIATNGYKSAGEGVAKAVEKRAVDEFNSTLDDAKSVIDSARNIPVPSSNPLRGLLSDLENANRQPGGIQTDQSDCISTNLNPELDECRSTSASSEPESIWFETRNLDVAGDSSILGCEYLPKELVEFAKKLAEEKRDAGCRVGAVSASGEKASFTYQCNYGIAVISGRYLLRRQKDIIVAEDNASQDQTSWQYQACRADPEDCTDAGLQAWNSAYPHTINPMCESADVPQ